MKNIEILNLTNATTIARTFDMTGSTGVTEINIDASKGGVNLTDLADASASLTYTGQATGTASIAFATGSAVLTGTTDALTVSLTNMGTADDAATTADETDDVVMTFNDIEELTLNVSGANVVSLDSADTKTITASGSGSLEVQNTSAALTTFDASAVTGAVEADLTDAAASSLKSVSTGTGDDKVTVEYEDTLVNATLAGGDGSDELVLTAANGVRQFVQSGFETVTVSTTGGAATLDLTNTTGVNKLAIGTGVTENVTLNAAGSGDLTVELQEDNNSADTTTVDNTGAANVTLKASAAAITAASAVETNTNSVTATKATSGSLSIGAFTEAAGTYKFDAATSVVVSAEEGKNSAGTILTEMSGDITANKAESLILDFTNAVLDAADITSTFTKSVELKSSTADAVLDLVTAAATNLTITANGNLDFNDGATDLGKVETMTVTTEGFADGTGLNLASVASLTVSGTNDKSQFNIENLGAGDLGYGISVTATGQKAGFEIGTVDVDDAFNIDINVSGVTGTSTIGAIGSNDEGNDVTVTAKGSGGNVDLDTIDALGAITVDASVTGTLDVGAIGGGTNSKSVTINTGATTGAVTIAAVTTDGLYTLNGGSTTGLITQGVIVAGSTSIDVSGTNKGITLTGGAAAGDTLLDITVDTTATYVGTNALANSVEINNSATGTTLTASVTGGLLDDDFDILGGAATTKFVVSGTGKGLGTDTLDITGTNAADTEVDASGVTDSKLGATITTAGGDDTIKGGAGGDTIDAGAGDDTITGNGGADTFKYSTGTDGADTFTDFATTVDTYETDFATTLGTGADAVVTSAAVNTGAALVVDTTASDVVQVTGVTLAAGNAADEASVIAAISNGTITVTAYDTFLLSVVTGTTTYLYEVTEKGTNALITAAEDDIVLVGTFSNGVTFATGDIDAA